MAKKSQLVEPVVVDKVVEDKQMVPEPPKPETLSEADRHILEVASMTMKIARTNAEKAIAENNAADVSYRYIVLQLYVKYGLTPADAMDEKGVIHRGVNVGGGNS